VLSAEEGTYPTKGQRILRWAVERWEKDNRLPDDEARAEVLDAISGGVFGASNAVIAENVLDALLKRGYKITKE
jgi:hypothetical protein